MERMACWPLANRPYVCIAACTLEFESVIAACSTQYEVVILRACAILLSKHTTMAMTNESAFVG